MRPQVQAIEDRLRQLRQETLNKLIENVLLEQAARAEGLSVDEYLARRIESIQVPASDVDQAYARSRDQFPGILPAEAKYRIRRTLEDNARAAAMNSLLKTLQENASVTNYLISDAMATLEAAAHEGPSSGSPDAPATIVEFSDFECPYCKNGQPVIQRIMERWPGRVRRVFKHFPLEQHPYAMLAARTAVCADRQGRVWDVHRRIFEASNGLSEMFLRSAALDAGVQAADFDACMQNKAVVEQVRRDVLVGRRVGVSGTPAFFLNQQPVASPAALEAAVEKLLAGDTR
jgi:protein-disulfide isomerase